MNLVEVPHVMSFDWPNSLTPLISHMEGKSLLNFCEAFGEYLMQKRLCAKIVVYQGSLTDEIFQAFLEIPCNDHVVHIITSTGLYIHSDIQFNQHEHTLWFYGNPRGDIIMKLEKFTEIIWEMHSQLEKKCYDPTQEISVHVDVKLQVPTFLVPFLEHHGKIGTSGWWISYVLTQYLHGVQCATSVYVGSVEQPIFHAIGYWSQCPGDHGYYHYDILTMDLINGGCISHGIKPNKEEPFDNGRWGVDSTNLAELKHVCKLLLRGEPMFSP